MGRLPPGPGSAAGERIIAQPRPAGKWGATKPKQPAGRLRFGRPEQAPWGWIQRLRAEKKALDGPGGCAYTTRSCITLLPCDVHMARFVILHCRTRMVRCCAPIIISNPFD